MGGYINKPVKLEQKMRKTIPRRRSIGRLPRVKPAVQESEENDYSPSTTREDTKIVNYKIDDEVISEINNLEIGNDVVLEKGNFRFKNQKCMLTYRTHLNKEAYKTWLSEKLKGKKVKTIHLAHETGDKHHNYLHTHVVLDFGYQHQTTNVHWFDFEGIHPNVKKILTPTHWNNCLIYLSKEDPANAHLAKQDISNLYEKILSFQTNREAYVNCVKRPSDFSGVKLMRESVKVESKNKVNIPEDEYLPWQKVFTKITKRQAGEYRVINWLIDERGGCGKTKWCKHMEDNSNDGWVYINNVGTKSDFGQNIRNLVDRGWKGEGIIIDLPRSYTRGNELYECLESIVDGRITTTKYTGGTIDIGFPKVWVFANFRPTFKSLSLDRWRILHVSGKKYSRIRLLEYKDTKTFLPKSVNSGYIGFSFCRPCISSESSGDYDNISMSE